MTDPTAPSTPETITATGTPLVTMKPDLPQADVAVAPDPDLVARIRSEIDLEDRARLATFGAAAQRDVASYADQILRQTANQDGGPIAELLSDMILKVNKLDPQSLKKGGFLDQLFGGMRARLVKFKEQFNNLASQIDRIGLELEKQGDLLKRDIAMLDGLYDRNLGHLRALEAYIVAGTEVVREALTTHIPEMERQVAAAGEGNEAQLKAQQLNDLRQAVDRLERKIHDLKTSRIIALQTLPQIRLIQNGNEVLIDKLQSSLTATIPTWKNQMTIALAIHRQEEAVRLQREVSDTTNDMLRRNAENLRSGVTAVERESQRAIVDIETLTHVNQQLVGTIQDVMRIQQEGRQRRALAEREMRRIEAELKQTLAENAPVATRGAG